MKKIVIGGVILVFLLLLILTGIYFYKPGTMPAIQNSTQVTSPAVTTTSLSDSQIVGKVAAVPEVKAFIKDTIAAKGSPHITIHKVAQTDSASGQQYWLVRVFKDGSKLPVTYAWYRYYLQSGTIQKNP